MICLLAMSSMAAAENYNYLELSQGIKVKNAPWKESNWNGDYPTAFSIGRHWEYNKTFYFRAQFNHTSNIDRGAPFNTKKETWLDQVNVTLGIKF